jgi:hypothetical protein
MQWVSDKLPPFVHLVLSTLPDVGRCLDILRQKFENTSARFLEVPQLDSKVSDKNQP